MGSEPVEETRVIGLGCKEPDVVKDLRGRSLHFEVITLLGRFQAVGLEDVAQEKRVEKAAGDQVKMLEGVQKHPIEQEQLKRKRRRDQRHGTQGKKSFLDKKAAPHRASPLKAGNAQWIRHVGVIGGHSQTGFRSAGAGEVAMARTRNRARLVVSASLTGK